MQCPRGKFQFKGQCHLCHHTCLDCSGSEPNKCTACGTGKKNFLLQLFLCPWPKSSLFSLLSGIVVRANKTSRAFVIDLHNNLVLTLETVGTQLIFLKVQESTCFLACVLHMSCKRLALSIFFLGML